LLKNGFTLRQQNSGTLRGEVFVSFMYIQSELMNVSAGVGYVYSYSTIIYIQLINFLSEG